MHENVVQSESPVQTILPALQTFARQLESGVRFTEVGTVQHIGSGVATISGLPAACTDELVVFPTGVRGLVFNLGYSDIDIILLGPNAGIRGGDIVKSLGEQLSIPIGPQLLGRVVNALGEPLDRLGPIGPTEWHTIERDAPGIVERSPITEPLQTGLKVIDALVPIGRGQRELIIGDRQTGKTSIAVDTILNQHNQDVYCVYVAISQKKSHTRSVINKLQEAGAMEYTIVVASSPDDPPALRYLAPYSGCTIAEYFLDRGRDTLIVYDDLSKHADTYRELSLLQRRPPGRDAYPGDVFYLHSRLLERAGKLSEDKSGATLTTLPIVQTQRGQLAAYIPTNLISITDGQLVLDANLFNMGIKPAVNAGQSVSRVGGAAQTPAMRVLSGTLRLELAQYDEVAQFTRFGAEVNEATQRQIKRGQLLQKVLTQEQYQPLSLASQVLVLYAAMEGYLDRIDINALPAFERSLLTYFDEHHPESKLRLNREGKLDTTTTETLRRIIEDVLVMWHQRS